MRWQETAASLARPLYGVEVGVARFREIDIGALKLWGGKAGHYAQCAAGHRLRRLLHASTAV